MEVDVNPVKVSLGDAIEEGRCIVPVRAQSGNPHRLVGQAAPTKGRENWGRTDFDEQINIVQGGNTVGKAYTLANVVAPVQGVAESCRLEFACEVRGEGNRGLLKLQSGAFAGELVEDRLHQ